MADQRKFYCEFCRVLIPYNHKDISAHEKTQKHKRNKDRNLQDLNRKARKEKEKTPHFRSGMPPNQKEEMISMMNEINTRAFRQYEVDCQHYGQPQNPELKPDVIPTPIELPIDKDPEKSQNLFGDVWSLRVDTDTGKLCFYNKISGKVQFQKPVGLKLTEKEKEIWDTQNNNPEGNDGLFGPAISKLTLAGNVGQWEEVNPNDDYYERNAYVSDGGESSDLDPELRKLEEKAEKKPEEPNLIDRNEENHQKLQNEQNDQKIKIIVDKKFEQNEEKDVIDELLEYKDQSNFGKSTMKLKNERLIKLAEENFELGVFEKPTYKKQEKEEIEGSTVFKKRKANNAKAVIIKPEDSP